jgi:hypothetical protein
MEEQPSYTRSWKFHTLTHLLRSGIVLCLFVLPTAMLATFVFSRLEPTKQLLRESQIYESLQQAMSTQASTPQLASAYGIDTMSLQKAIKKSFSADTLQKKSENLIDNNYAWLEGSRSQPDTTLNFSDTQRVLASVVANESQAQFAAKPVCSNEQLWQYVRQLESTPLSAPCRPEQTDFAVFRNKIEETILQTPSSADVGPSALEQGAGIAMADTIQNPQRTGLTQQQTSIARGVFWFGSYAFWIVLCILVILITAICIVYKSFIPISHTLVVPFFTAGAIMTIYSMIGLWLLVQKIQLLGGTSSLTQSTLQFFGSYSLRIQLYFGISYILISVILFIAWRVLKQVQHDNHPLLGKIPQ